MIWENNTFEEKKKYCNNNINQKLTEDFWSELLALFGNSLYTKGEKKIILDQWAKILDTKGTKGWDYNELMNDARRLTVRLYKITNESNNMDALMGCLTCFVIKNSFTVEQLNDFLIKNGFQYYYTEEGEWKLIQNSIDKKKILYL